MGCAYCWRGNAQKTMEILLSVFQSLLGEKSILACSLSLNDEAKSWYLSYHWLHII